MRASVRHPNDRPNFCRFDIGPVTLWFSYETVIAFMTPNSNGAVVRANEWGPTTGKHLKLVEETSYTRRPRVEGEEFEWELSQALACFQWKPEPTVEEIREEFIKELVDV